MNSFRSISSFTLLLVIYVCLVPFLQAQTSTTLDKKIIAANRELDQRLMDAHALKDAALVESLFSESSGAFLLTLLVTQPKAVVTSDASGRPGLTRWKPSVAIFRTFPTSRLVKA